MLYAFIIEADEGAEIVEMSKVEDGTMENNGRAEKERKNETEVSKDQRVSYSPLLSKYTEIFNEKIALRILCLFNLVLYFAISISIIFTKSSQNF